MALQTTGLEFFYLSVDFFENDKILLVEQELGYNRLGRSGILWIECNDFF